MFLLYGAAAAACAIGGANRFYAVCNCGKPRRWVWLAISIIGALIWMAVVYKAVVVGAI